jgi:CubicO group peptidase (beta-lactamase class C family)
MTTTILPAPEAVTTAVEGTCDPRFSRVRDVLAANLASGADIGASAAVFIDGSPIVDIWGGFADAARTQPWTRDTIVNNFSTTKTMTALCALILADRGELDLDAPVVKYWPEFAAEGKRDVLVRHLLSHSAGLPGWNVPMTIADILDREKATTLLARQAPWWAPGTAVGYHAITFGPLVGEVIRRVTGRPLGQFFAEDVAGPLGADYHIGTGPDCDERVAVMIAGTGIRPRTGADTITDRVFFNPYVTPEDSGTIEWRRGELGGSNGHGNARSVAAVQSVLSAGGDVRGVRLLSRAGCERALAQQADETDLVCGFPLRWGLGYGLENPFISSQYRNRPAGRRIAFWGGAGGSIVVNDFDARMTVAFVMNRHLEHGGIDQRGIDVVCAAYDSLADLR